MKKLPIGIDDFKKLREKNAYYKEFNFFSI